MFKFGAKNKIHSFVTITKQFYWFRYVYEPEEPGLLEKNIKIAREGLGSVSSQVKSQLSEVSFAGLFCYYYDFVRKR